MMQSEVYLDPAPMQNTSISDRKGLNGMPESIAVPNWIHVEECFCTSCTAVRNAITLAASPIEAEARTIAEFAQVRDAGLCTCTSCMELHRRRGFFTSAIVSVPVPAIVSAEEEEEEDQCDHCEDWFPVGTLNTLRRVSLCDHCYNTTVICDDCSERINIADAYNGDDDEYRCSSCHDDYETRNSSALVHGYSYSPPQYRMYGDGPLFHGVELEVGWQAGDKSDYAESVIDALGEYAFLKEDGSICSANVNDGFEIVTHPASLLECGKRLKAICDKNVPGLISHDAGGGLGLHISVNRNALSNHAIARICTFIGGEQNNAWIVKLARRTSSQWATIVKKDTIEDTLEVSYDGSTYLKVNPNRYEAVNLQNSTHIEFRLFRGTLKYSSLMTSLEFVNALCLWCMEQEEVQNYQDSAVFEAFVAERAETYPYLLKFLSANI
jgi:hypothetical protein